MKLSAVVLFLACPVVLAQSPSVPAPPSLRTQSTIVLVPALVRNARGELVFTLKAGDFRVTDDGIEQPLTLDEDTGGEPLALVIAVEVGGAGRTKLEDYGHLGAVIGAVVSAVPHRVAVVAFDSTPSLEQDFTSDVDAVGAVLGDVGNGDKGAAILDVLKFSVDQLRRQPPNYRRAILLISETIDRGSQTTMDDALRAISDTNTTIYSLAFSSGKAQASKYAYKNLPTQPNGLGLSNPNPSPPHGCMGKDPADPDPPGNAAVRVFDCLTQLLPPLGLAKIAAIRAADSLQQNVPETVAQLTGGEYFRFENARSLVSGMLTISNHVPNRYVLSFQPHSPHAGFHAVELRLNKDHPGLRVTARSGYWVDGDAAADQPPGLSP
jgi:VWFA-related protein